jgi:LAO/AO transport system kinase
VTEASNALSRPLLSERVLQGDPRAMARAISLIEDEAPEGAELVRRIFPHTGRAYLVGVTGAPGAGKSTLVDRLIAELRGRRQSIGVVAVDPTSPFSGGAILGDRVRMRPDRGRVDRDARARYRRRGAGAQGRDHGDCRHLRRQQGGPRGGGPHRRVD